MNEYFNKTSFLGVVEENSAIDLAPLHLLLFDTIPGKNVIRNNLRKFNGFDQEQQIDIIEKILTLNVNETMKICDLMEIIYNHQETKESLAEKLSKRLCRESTIQTQTIDNNIPNMNVPERENRSCRDDHTTNTDNQDYMEVIDIDNRSSRETRTRTSTQDIYEKIEYLDEEYMKLLIEIDNVENIIDNLDTSSEERESVNKEKRSFQRKLVILQSKIRNLDNKRNKFENQLDQINQDIKHRRDKRYLTEEWIENGTEMRNRTNDESNHLQLANNVNSQTNTIPRENINLQETLSAMALRQSVGTQLPEFDGSSVLTWNHFLLQFNLTTEQCNITNEENILRLNKFIKGEARSKIDLLLMTSKSPKPIIDILNRQYGGEEKIIKELIDRIHKISFVDSMDKFEDFNCSVQNTTAILINIKRDLFDIQKLLSLYLDKLPEHVVMQWVSFLMINQIDSKNVNFKIFSEWINTTSAVIHDVNFFSSIQKTEYKDYNDKKEAKIENKNDPIDKTCKICKVGEHYAERCNEFIQASVDLRWEYSRKYHLCFNCLKVHKGSCRKQACSIQNCRRRHHELLHKEGTNNIVAHINNSNQQVLLKMMPIKITGPYGSLDIVALLDEGSTLTLLDNSISDAIGLTGEEKPLCFKWTGGIFRTEAKSKIVTTEVSGRNGNIFKMDNVRTVKNLELPSQQTDLENLINRYPDLKKFDLTCIKNKRPMILISQQHASIIASREIIEIEPDNNGPLITKTKLGWALHGPVNWNSNNIENFICCQITDEAMDRKLENFFKLESFGVCIPNAEKNKQENDEKAIKCVKSSIKMINGQYEVKLPWKDQNSILPNSFPMALQRFKCLERKFNVKFKISVYKTS